ncbi:MAG: efflux RND transporter periplasmic adaptor subunit, partial [Acidobacteriia bacterium]|nr:efflux RND transporter periplasmic adaptor subunit [Terriglobia bacterium]
MKEHYPCNHPRVKNSARRWNPVVGSLASVFLSVALLSGCSGKSAPGKVPDPQMRSAVPVMVAAVVQKTVPVEIRAIGTGEAFSTVAVKAMVNGEITRVNFVEGQDVKKGELLFSIDSRSYAAALNQAEANLARDQAQVKYTSDQAQRYANLYQQGIVPKQLADQYQSSYDTLEEAIRADKAAVENSKVQLSYCSIYSPLDGRTGSLLIHQGNVVKANDTLSMVVINQVTPIYVDFSVPEQFLPDIKKHMAAGKLGVKGVIPNDEGSPEPGVLTFVNNTVDSNTGTILLKGTFPNSRRRLWPGQFVNVVLTLSARPNAVIVPTRAIQTGQEGQFVFVVKPDRTVESRPVVVGAALDADTVIEKGLQVGESVVTDGQLRLVPGSRVEIKSGLRATEVKS